jgi:hypothetical protein
MGGTLSQVPHRMPQIPSIVYCVGLKPDLYGEETSYEHTWVQEDIKIQHPFSTTVLEAVTL